MPVPRPGSRVRGSRSGQPIMALLDLLGRRWALRILWELRDGPLGYTDLQARCDRMSPSVLAQRLGELRDTTIVGTDATGAYELTTEGRALLGALAPLAVWAKRWGARLRAPAR